MKRSKHSLSHYKLATFDMGELVPVSCFEVLPGDSIRMSTSSLLRLSPLLQPVMHPVDVRIHHWYLPYRVAFDKVDPEVLDFDWEAFITGGPDGMDSQTFPATDGTITVQAGSPADYMGVPPGANRTYSIAPILTYYSIWNEYYRDQDLATAFEVGPDGVGELATALKKVAWQKDRFTAARPWVQKGPEITIPLGSTAPITGTGAPTFDVGAVLANTLRGSAVDADVHFPGLTAAADAVWNDPQLEADLSAATGATPTDIRLAFALQRYQEARAQFGSRYTEYLRYLGVRSSDARLQRPEYLGGGRATVSFSEVLRTGNVSDDDPDLPIGQMAGHGISALRTRAWTKFFEEHGTVMTLASVRPRTMYGNGLSRMWTRSVKEDFWQKELELVGQEEVAKTEVYADDSGVDPVLGYNNRYDTYRSVPSSISGDFRTTLADYHLARIFASNVALNEDFITCSPSKRIFAEQTQDSLWGMFSHSIQARRLVGNRTIGRIL